jgi:hypothetical protein
VNHSQALRSYRHADGSTHEVVVHRTPDGDWQVLDTSPAGTSVVETLSGITDGRAQAEALARDYAATAPRSIAAKGRNRAERIPEKRGAHGHSDHHTRPKARKQKARAASLPDPAC